jgi:hypothetical protein
MRDRENNKKSYNAVAKLTACPPHHQYPIPTLPFELLVVYLILRLYHLKKMRVLGQERGKAET